MKKSLRQLVTSSMAVLMAASVATTLATAVQASDASEEEATEETLAQEVVVSGESTEETSAEDESAADDDSDESAEESVEESAEEDGSDETESAEDTEDETADESEETEAAEEEAQLVFKLGYAAPHGERSFASVAVVMDGDVVVDVVIDEFQFMDSDDWTTLPSSDAAFGEGYADDNYLVSKRENNDDYSDLMAEHAGATASYADNLDAIQDFAKGKTLADIEAAIAELNGLGEDGDISEVVSGATFVDTAGYLQAIVDVANGGYDFPVATGENIELKQAYSAPNGDRGFAITVVALDGDTIVGAAIDEFEFTDAENGWEAVPNSDAAFADGYADGKVLYSKTANTVAYSEVMAEIAGSTVSYMDNIQAITNFVVGKTADEVEAAADEVTALGEDGDVSEVVSGATFVNTAGYLESIVEAAKK